MAVSTQLSQRQHDNGARQPSLSGWRRFAGVAVCLVPFAAGCAWDKHLFTPPPAPPPPVDSLVLRGDKLEADNSVKQGASAAELAGAQDIYRQGNFAEAEKFFHRIAENTKNSPQVAEEARYYEAECLRRQQKYPKAADTYNRMLNDFPSGAYLDQAVQHMFEIANYWLDDSRKAIVEEKEGKHWVVWPEWFHPVDPTKPLFDEEGRALEKLEQVRYNQMMGPLADKALFLTGSIKFHHKDYKDAEHAYSQLVEFHPNSPLAPQAIKLAIISKQLSTGGPDYDSRKLVEARRLVDSALRNYPELASKDGDFLNRQLFSISMQQAAKDYDIAKFYERTGKPCSAWFCYEIVRRRYPGTKYFDMATERMNALRPKVEKQQGKALPNGPPVNSSAPTTLPAAVDRTQQPAGASPRNLPPDVLKGF
jgi:outer membrane protein assembly factor BamD (BamD/ComL family)